MSYINYEHFIERVTRSPEKPIFNSSDDEMAWLEYCLASEPRVEIRRNSSPPKDTFDAIYTGAMYDTKELSESGIHAGMRDVFRFVKTYGNIKKVAAKTKDSNNLDEYWREASDMAQRLCSVYSDDYGGKLINNLIQSVFDWLAEQYESFSQNNSGKEVCAENTLQQAEK